VRAGNAARLAALEAKNKLFKYVGDKLEANPEDLVARDGKIYVKGSPHAGMTFRDAIKGYQYADLPMPIVGRASWFPPATEPTTLFKEDGNFSPNYSFMAQAAEVEVDLEMGKVKLIKMVTAHDCGRAINPMLVEGQLEGSVVGGMGQALYENIIVEKGQVMNPSFLDYGFPTFMEMPEIEAIEVETDDPIGPFGAKEAGEGTQLSPAPAIVNAIYDAIGIDYKELPVTPEDILTALKGKRG
jgi:CO/xanthine dehydrogenase Mo-binding subunit